MRNALTCRSCTILICLSNNVIRVVTMFQKWISTLTRTSTSVFLSLPKWNKFKELNRRVCYDITFPQRKARGNFEKDSSPSRWTVWSLHSDLAMTKMIQAKVSAKPVWTPTQTTSPSPGQFIICKTIQVTSKTNFQIYLLWTWTHFPWENRRPLCFLAPIEGWYRRIFPGKGTYPSLVRPIRMPNSDSSRCPRRKRHNCGVCSYATIVPTRASIRSRPDSTAARYRSRCLGSPSQDCLGSQRAR